MNRKELASVTSDEDIAAASLIDHGRNVCALSSMFSTLEL